MGTGPGDSEPVQVTTESGPEPVDSVLNVVEDHKEIPQVNPLDIKPAQAGPVVPATAAQKHTASKAIIRQSLRTLNVPIIYGTGYLTNQRVTNEAAFTDAEIEALSEVWAPLVSVDNPMAIAIVTTMGIVGNKTMSVMALNRERKNLEIEGTVRPVENEGEDTPIPTESEGDTDGPTSAGIHSEHAGSDGNQPLNAEIGESAE